MSWLDKMDFLKCPSARVYNHTHPFGDSGQWECNRCCDTSVILLFWHPLHTWMNISHTFNHLCMARWCLDVNGGRWVKRTSNGMLSLVESMGDPKNNLSIARHIIRQLGPSSAKTAAKATRWHEPLRHYDSNSSVTSVKWQKIPKRLTQKMSIYKVLYLTRIAAEIFLCT